MSEEIYQRNYDKKGDTLGIYEYYRIGATNFKTLKKFEIIPNKNYNEFEVKKPDAILVDRRDKTNIKVILAIEYKSPDEFSTQDKKDKAIDECWGYCNALQAKIGIATDGQEWIWFNPPLDPKNGKKWDLVRNEDAYSLQSPFTVSESDVLTNLRILGKVLGSLTPTNSTRIEKESSKSFKSD